MPQLDNIHQNEKGDWVATTGYGSEVPVDVLRTSFMGTPLDVEYQGEKYNEVHGGSRYESPKDEDSDK